MEDIIEFTELKAHTAIELITFVCVSVLETKN